MADRAWLRLTVFAAGLAVAVGAGFTLGRVVFPPAGPVPATGPGNGQAHPDAAAVAGVAVSSGGYTLVAETSTLPAGQPATVRFRIDSPTGQRLLRYGVADGRLMHLLLVRHDLSAFTRLTPSLSADGIWTAPVTLPEPGSWRMLTDFTPVTDTGPPGRITLGTDLSATGAGQNPPATPASTSESTVDGYTVGLTGTPAPGTSQQLALTVRKDGTAIRITDAPTRLTALRAGDLGVLHAEPGPADTSPVTQRFHLSVPTAGGYRLFYDFTIGGITHTAVFTVTTP